MLRGFLVAVAASLLLAGCGDGTPAERRQPAGAPLPSVMVKAATGSREALFEGRVEGIDQTTVRAQAPGRIAAVVHDVNDEVGTGTVVLRLRGIEQRAGLAQAEAALQEALAHETGVQQRHRRITGLYERKVVARAAFDEATAARDAAVARTAAARAARQNAVETLSYAEVAAPFAGIVAARHVQTGDVVAPGQPLFDLVSARQFRVVLDVPQSVATHLRGDRRGRVMQNGESINAVAVKVFAAAAPEAGTTRVWLELPPGTPDLFAGQFVRVALPAEGPAQLMIPVTALVERSEMTGVYVLAPDGRPVLRQIRVGHRDPAMVEALAGLSPGERVVTAPLAAMALQGAAATARP